MPERTDPPGLSNGVLLRLAFRNVRKSARRSILTASAMTLGLALLILSRTLADGAHESWIDQGVRLGAGHVAVQGEGYQTSKSLDDLLSAADLDGAVEALGSPQFESRVSAYAPRLTAPGLASSTGSSVPVLLTGVDPAVEVEFSPLDDLLAEGRYLEPDDRLAAYVGEGLVRRLGLRIGSRFVVTAADADGQIQGQLLRVRGVFRTGVPDLDQSLVHLPLSTAQDWLGTRGGVTSLAILMWSSRTAAAARRELRDLLPSRGVEVLTWTETAPELEAAVKIDDLGDWVFHGITLAIVALAILNAVLMSVLHRRREFGVLRALGLTANETGRVVIAEGVMLSVISGLLGIALGLGVVFGFWSDGLDMSFLMDQELEISGSLIDPVMVPAFRIAQIGWSLLFILFIGISASLYPARQAARIDVAEAMKFER